MEPPQAAVYNGITFAIRLLTSSRLGVHSLVLVMGTHIGFINFPI